MRDADRVDRRTGRMRIPRSRGAVSGLLLILLGVWGALIPFLGPYVNFAYEPNTPWLWTAARGWLEVLPGAVTVLGGLLMLMSANRFTALFGSWLAIAGGAWFVVGRVFAVPLGLGAVGAPVRTSQISLMALELMFFTGLGSLIIAFGAVALGRLSVRSVRDIAYARASVDEYHRADYERERDRERAALTATDEGAETRPVAGERRPRDWRHPFGGSRPLPH